MPALGYWYTLIFFKNPVLALIYHTLIYHNACKHNNEVLIMLINQLGLQETAASDRQRDGDACGAGHDLDQTHAHPQDPGVL